MCYQSKKKEKVDKNFDVDVKSMGSVFDNEKLSDDKEEDTDTIPKGMSASEIISVAKAKWPSHSPSSELESET